jgi:hypothetical protein
VPHIASPPSTRPRAPGVPAATAALALALLACGAPDRAPAPPSAGTASAPVSTRDTVVPSAPADTAHAIQFDTTNYFTATESADPDSVVRGRVAGLVVLDSAFLGTRRGTRTTAMLVRLGPETHPNYGYFRVYVVEASDSGRHARATRLDALGTVPRGKPGFGAADVDGDGRREPYLAGWTGGSGGYTVSVYVLDPRARASYWWYDLFSAWSYLEPRRGEFQNASPPPARVRRWMEAHASRVADVADPSARDTVVLRHHAVQRQWTRDHGVGFHQGRVRVRWQTGTVPFSEWAGCRTRGGDLEWFHDRSIWGYDRGRNRHFLLFDADRYTAPNGLVLGARNVWLSTTAPVGGGYGLLAYDRAHRRVRVVPIPELSGMIRGSCREGLCGGPYLTVRGGRLYGDSVALTLPDSIVPAVEFPDTGRVCTRSRDRS